VILSFIRYLRGWVRFKVVGRFPERFINVALKSGIGIFDVTPENGVMYASVLLADYRYIRPVARKAGVRLNIVRRYGLPFVLNKYKSRWGIAVGAILFVVLTLFLRSFIWTVDINGIETLSYTEVKQALESSGVCEGAFKPCLDTHKAERKLELEFEEIGWMSVNLIGTHATVEIKEKAKVPSLEYSSGVSNIKARRDGVILSTNVRRGTAEVSAGSAVSEGQIIVSGMYENSLQEIHFVDADAEVMAETYYDFVATCDEVSTVYIPESTGKRSELSFLWADIPLTFSPEHSPFTSVVITKQLHLGDTAVPVKLSTQHMMHMSFEDVILDENKAEEKLMKEFALYKLFSLSGAKEISATPHFVKTDSGYELNASIVCKEDIAVKENMIVNP